MYEYRAQIIECEWISVDLGFMKQLPPIVLPKWFILGHPRLDILMILALFFNGYYVPVFMRTRVV